MKQLRVTPRALADLEHIADYTIERWGGAKARTYVTAIRNRLAWIARHPLKGRPRDDIAEGYRALPQGSHLIFYVIVEDEVRIIGIPHGAMDLVAYFD